MEGISVKPRRAQVMTNVIALGILCGLSLTVPLIGVVSALMLPLFTCPLVKHKEEKLAWLVSIAPAAGWLLNGLNPWMAVGMLFTALFPLCATRAIPQKLRIGWDGILIYIGLIMLGAVGILMFFHSGLTAPLPDQIMKWVESSESALPLLLSLAQNGLISVPEGYIPGTAAEPAVMVQMLLSLRRTVEIFVESSLPMFITHVCLLIGLFTALRIEHLNGVMLVVEVDPNRPSERKAHVTSPPGFRLLALPREWRLLLIALALFSLLASGDESLRIFSLMTSQLILTSFQIVGAAVMVFVFARRNPDQITLIGAVVGLVYALLPTVPLLIGVSDSFIHYRTRKVREGSET